MLPDPSLLDAKSWEHGVLPNMGPRLGIFFYGSDKYPSYRKDPHLDRNYYPSKPVLSFVAWQSIIDYYTSISPDSLAKPRRDKPIQTNLPLFKVQYPRLTYNNPATVLVSINNRDSSQPLLISD
ncbi:MAG TPA: VCBS repeat-containing protein, partial [Chitinophagaceae bacterium]